MYTRAFAVSLSKGKKNIYLLTHWSCALYAVVLNKRIYSAFCYMHAEREKESMAISI